jgi:uncharacterized protein DUF3800
VEGTNGRDRGVEVVQRKRRDRPDKIVRLVYFDEAGTASIAQEPICVVASVPIDADRQWRDVERHLASIVRRLVPRKYRDGFEFHATKLFSNSKYPNWPKDERWYVLDRFLRTISAYSLPVIWAGCNRAEAIRLFSGGLSVKPQRMPHFFSFMACMYELERWFHNEHPDESGQCIADELDYEIAEAMREYLDTYRKRRLIRSMPRTRFEHLIESVTFRKSHKSFGVQLADSCNFFIKRHCMNKQNSEHFFEIIKPHLAAGQVHLINAASGKLSC